MRILLKSVDPVASPRKDLKLQQGIFTSCLKRSSPDEISLPSSVDQSSSSHKRRVQFQSSLKDSDYQTNEEIEIARLKKLSHDQCDAGKEFHKAICAGDDTKITLLLNGMNQADKIKLLHDLCAEEDFAGASALRLALRSNQLSLIGSLIKHGTNPFHCSADGNTLLHDIILDHSHAALKIFLAHTFVDEQFIKFINLPFHGKIYEGYFALDIICVEATFHFKSYYQALKIENKNIAVLIFSIIQKLILNHASSKLLNDENENLNDYLKTRTNKKYSNESIWHLIARIAELHELRNMPLLNNQPIHKIPHSDMSSSSSLVAQRWQSNGMLSETAIETRTNNDNALTDLSSSLPLSATTDAEIIDQLIALSKLPSNCKC